MPVGKPKRVKHIDLFSGIGGFSYAVDQVWENVEHIFVENDPFCTKVLKKYWPEAMYFGDIRTFTNTTIERHSEREQENNRPSENETPNRPSEVFILTGGFPCQPFSQAGRRRGAEDDRFLWPEMLRVIQLTKPQWVIAENVRGLVTWNDGLVFEQVCLDLEGEGYSVQSLIIPAVAVNAPHRRDRVWFIAHSGATRPTGECGEVADEGRNSSKDRGESVRQTHGTIGTGGASPTDKYDSNTTWEADWLEVATELCGVDDGLPAELDELKLTKAGHRVQRLKALGNAIVPQVAVEIMKSIKLCQKHYWGCELSWGQFYRDSR